MTTDGNVILIDASSKDKNDCFVFSAGTLEELKPLVNTHPGARAAALVVNDDEDEDDSY